MLKIAVYGKGGIGKSTISSNLSVALSERGYKVMQIGCDPKADSTIQLHQGHTVTSILDIIRARGDKAGLDELVTEGSGGVLCAEAGGPTPGMGCAGRGIITAFEALEERNAFEVYKPDVVIYDVLGDVVCGGFAMPIREGYADKVFIVTSGENMAIYAAANIAAAVKSFEARGVCQPGRHPPQPPRREAGTGEGGGAGRGHGNGNHRLPGLQPSGGRGGGAWKDCHGGLS